MSVSGPLEQRGVYYLLNLGCAKNLVEGEHLAGRLIQAGFQPGADPAAASLLLVNTCGFIQPAVEESIEAILDLAREKTPGQMLAVVGCLVGRYGRKLARSLPEVDLFLGPGDLRRLEDYLTGPRPGVFSLTTPRGVEGASSPRALATGPGWAYLRLADGCNRRCAYCTIPAIRGRLRSRRPEDVLEEARRLAGEGMVELNLVAQDLTAYGEDLGMKGGLAGLLPRLAEIPGLAWIRPLYLHPDYLDEELIEVMSGTPGVLPYFDLPIQHYARSPLDLMGRRRSGPALDELVEGIRARCPGATLRCTVMLGHPGEDEAAFGELLSFLERARFDHLGAFAYCPEAGTRSARLPAPDKKTAEQRRKKVHRLAEKISRRKLKDLKGRETDVLYLGPHPESELLGWGRLTSQAPEVDGEVLVVEGSAKPGSLVRCRITAAHTHDVEAQIL